jgi:hypothetical protein
MREGRPSLEKSARFPRSGKGASRWRSEPFLYSGADAGGRLPPSMLAGPRLPTSGDHMSRPPHDHYPWCNLSRRRGGSGGWRGSHTGAWLDDGISIGRAVKANVAAFVEPAVDGPCEPRVFDALLAEPQLSQRNPDRGALPPGPPSIEERDSIVAFVLPVAKELGGKPGSCRMHQRVVVGPRVCAKRVQENQ